MDLPAANHCPIRSLLVERRIDRPEAKRCDHDCEHSAQDAAQPIAFGREIPAEQHQYGEADKESEHWGHGIFDFRFSIFDLLIASLIRSGLVTAGKIFLYPPFGRLL